MCEISDFYYCSKYVKITPMTGPSSHAPNSAPEQEGDGEPWFERDLRAVEKKLGDLAIPKPKESSDDSTEAQPTGQETTEAPHQTED